MLIVRDKRQQLVRARQNQFYWQIDPGDLVLRTLITDECQQ